MQIWRKLFILLLGISKYSNIPELQSSQDILVYMQRLGKFITVITFGDMAYL
jgi:hypothetical protein